MWPRSAPGFIPVSLRKMTKGEGAMASDILGYKGKRVVVMGCFSGTGEACARALVDLGAEGHGADIKPSPVNLASFTEVDLKNPDAIAAGIAAIGGRIDAVFNVSGLPQTFPGEDVITVNFLGIRAWTEGWIPHLNPGAAIVSVSSLGGMKWLTRQPDRKSTRLNSSH